MKAKTSKTLKCWRISAFFYVVLNCVSGLVIALFASFLLLFHEESHIARPRLIVLYFLIVPVLCTAFSTFVGCMSIKKKKFRLVKFFAALLTATVILEIAGSLWCVASLQETQDEVLLHVENKFTNITTNILNENWWNNIQKKLKCCGLHGPTDYNSMQAVPFSCCGSDPEDHSQGFCTIVWQKGCSDALTKELSSDLILLSLIGICIALLQIPGVFVSWCFANRISREVT